MSLKCITGEDKGMEARYTTTSVGGKKAVQAIGVALAEQVEKDQTKPVACRASEERPLRAQVLRQDLHAGV
jgi:hypothetical protein